MSLRFNLLGVALVPLMLVAAPQEKKGVDGKKELTAPTRFEYRMAMEALRNRDMQMAWDYLRQDCYLNPRSGWPVAESARLMYYSQMPDEAEKSAQNALKLLPKKCGETADVNCLLGYMALGKKDTAQAMKAFQAAIKAAPDSISGYLSLADIYDRRNQFKQEEKIIDQMKKIAPDLSLVFLYGCRNYEMQGRPIEAIKDGKRALELDSTDLQIHSFLATAYFDTECPALGCKEVVAALADPRIDRALHQFATYGLYYEEEMERATLAAIRQQPRLHDYYTSLYAGVQITAAQYLAHSDSAKADTVQVLIRMHRDKALNYLLQVEHPTAPDLYNIACLYALKNDKQAAIDYLHRSVEAGYDDKQWAMQDEDLINLHLMPEYLDLLEQMEHNKMMNGK